MQAHWKDCDRCSLHTLRRNVVIGRGDLPAQVMMIGEAPRKSEDLRGLPFVGPSGSILDEAIKIASSRVGKRPTVYISTVVACRPTDRKHGENREPELDEALSCWPRLQELERLVMPDRIVILGNVAEHFLRAQFPAAVKLQDPDYIVRAGGIGTGEFRIFVRKMQDLFAPLTDPDWIKSNGGSYHV